MSINLLPLELCLHVAIIDLRSWRAMLAVPLFGRGSVSLQEIAYKRFFVEIRDKYSMRSTLNGKESSFRDRPSYSFRAEFLSEERIVCTKTSCCKKIGMFVSAHIEKYLHLCCTNHLSQFTKWYKSVCSPEYDAKEMYFTVVKISRWRKNGVKYRENGPVACAKCHEVRYGATTTKTERKLWETTRAADFVKQKNKTVSCRNETPEWIDRPT